MNIRPAKPSDKARLLNLMEQFYTYTKTDLATGFLAAFNELKPEMTLAQMATDDFPKDLELVLVAEEGGQLIGYVSAKTNDRPQYVLNKEGRIHGLFVVASHRGKGIGRRLFEEMERMLADHGCTHMSLESFMTNISANAIYHRLGFIDDSVIMQKVIHSQ